MGARFAGSQRSGDRRRRRLAVESDELVEATTVAGELFAPQKATRVADGAHADQSAGFLTAGLSLPLSALVPREWWKYLIGATACLSIVGGLAVAATCAGEWAAVLGPGIERLFAPPAAPAGRWFSSVLLTLSAQLALLIWWARSRSLKDFDGRYWLWIRVAGAWLAFAACVATQAHDAVGELVVHLRPGILGNRAFLGWLIPASVIGLWIVFSLAREMKGCRWSRALLFVAVSCHLVAVAWHLEAGGTIIRASEALWQQICPLCGHVSLFLSMWLHARHVLYCTADPAERPRSKWRIPRPHFRLPKLGRNQRSKELQPDGDRTPARRKRPAKETTTPASPAASPQPDDATPKHKTTAAGKPHFRVDSQNEGMSRFSPAGPADSNAASGAALAARLADEGAAISHSRQFSPVEMSDSTGNAARSLDAAQHGSDAQDPEDDEPGDSLSKPDLRGLSKKQRRRVLQELRDRERATGQ